MTITVTPIGNLVARDFIERYHNTHKTKRTALYLGLMNSNDGLVGVSGFDYGPFPNFGRIMSHGLYSNKEVLRQVRFCLSEQMSKNSESYCLAKLVSYVKSLNKFKLLISYVGGNEIGVAWQACNWLYIGTGSKQKPTGNTASDTYHRYVLPIGTRKERKEFLRVIKAQPYPKKVLTVV